jgi:hypothetical protein
MSFGARREGGGFFVTHMDPVNRFPPPHHVGDTIERVAHDPVNPLDTGLLKRFDKKFRGGPAHVLKPFISLDLSSPRGKGKLVRGSRILPGLPTTSNFFRYSGPTLIRRGWLVMRYKMLYDVMSAAKLLAR